VDANEKEIHGGNFQELGPAQSIHIHDNGGSVFVTSLIKTTGNSSAFDCQRIKRGAICVFNQLKLRLQGFDLRLQLINRSLPWGVQDKDCTSRLE